MKKWYLETRVLDNELEEELSRLESAGWTIFQIIPVRDLLAPRFNVLVYKDADRT